MKKTKEKMLCIRVTEELMKELDIVAMQAGYKRSRFGRSILERYLSDAMSILGEVKYEELERGLGSNGLCN